MRATELKKYRKVLLERRTKMTRNLSSLYFFTKEVTVEGTQGGEAAVQRSLGVPRPSAPGQELEDEVRSGLGESLFLQRRHKVTVKVEVPAVGRQGVRRPRALGGAEVEKEGHLASIAQPAFLPM